MSVLEGSWEVITTKVPKHDHMHSWQPPTHAYESKLRAPSPSRKFAPDAATATAAIGKAPL